MGKSDQKEKQPNENPSTEAASPAPQPESDSGISEWFATLSIEERARALGFSDDTILSFLIKHASLASSASQKSGGTAESGTDEKGEINNFALHFIKSLLPAPRREFVTALQKLTSG